ncbi:MAG: hypothetical protein IPM21_03760 [Acidobacteria bacterium]|nr:hypothetical protein [Acidobacteriota bacterium]
MKFDEKSAVERSKRDLAERLGVGENEISVKKVASTEFPDMSLGAPEDGEMAAQMIATGWKIGLASNGKDYEYRADKYQLRLKDFKGRNHVIVY